MTYEITDAHGHTYHYDDLRIAIVWLRTLIDVFDADAKDLHLTEIKKDKAGNIKQTQLF